MILIKTVAKLNNTLNVWFKFLHMQTVSPLSVLAIDVLSIKSIAALLL
jgi:hypothetical protein